MWNFLPCLAVNIFLRFKSVKISFAPTAVSQNIGIGNNIDLILNEISSIFFSLFTIITNGSAFNPIRSGLFQTANDPGGGALKAPPPPPYDLENYFVNLYHIIHVHFTRCFRHVPIENFQKFAILTILQRFQNKK